MAGSLKLRLGVEVRCAGESVGELDGIVLDGATHVVTHLDIRSKDVGRFLPITDVASAGDLISVSLTYEEFFHLDSDTTLTQPPYFGSDLAYDGNGWSRPHDRGIRGPALNPFGYAGYSTLRELNGIPVSAVPDDEFMLQGHLDVQASDGRIGRIDGIVIDGSEFRPTHLLLARGHFFGTREVAIPFGAVADVTTEGAKLSWSKQQVEQLPELDLRRVSLIAGYGYPFGDLEMPQCLNQCSYGYEQNQERER